MPTTKKASKKRVTKSKKTKLSRAQRVLSPFFASAVVLVLFLLSALAVMMTQSTAQPLNSAGPVSRQVLAFQETVIMANKPAPTIAALQYAYVASAYDDALVASNQSGALEASNAMLHTLYPDKVSTIDAAFVNLASSNQLSYGVPSPAVQAIIDKYQTRYAHDGHDLAWDGVIPTGDGKWYRVTDKDPMTPRAGDWQRWNVTKAITVPAPPVYGSAEDLKQLEIVKDAVATRNGQDINTINFWGGTPGTSTPSGIWQNQLYLTAKGDLPNDALKADARYALVQKTLAQTLSDAFMECWKVKYVYWTARPSMRIPGLATAMNDPIFPSYISGHSTISKAAADVLSVQVPKYAKSWESMAMEARNSRVKAGIHFEVDNAVGFQVGTDVAKQEVASQQLTAVIK